MAMRWSTALLFGVAVLAAACQGTSGVSTTTTKPNTTTTSATTAAPTTTVPTTTLPPATTTTVAPDPVDIIFTGGPVVTMDPDIGTVEAIAIDGDRIIAVGTADDIARYEGPDTELIDIAGRAVQPGFIDPHTHLLTDAGGVESGQAIALPAGFTSLSDASVEPGAQEEFFTASQSGTLKERTSLYLVRGDVCGNDDGTWYEEFPPGSTVGERVRIAGVKIFADGGVCGALATSETILEGYESEPPFFDPETLTEMIRTADAAGYQVIIHALGDLAIAEVQDAYAEVLDGGLNPLHHRIDHNAIQSDETITRYNDLGVIAVLFGSSEACRADLAWTDFYKEYGDRPGDIISANPDLFVAWHGDDPWMSPISPISELYGLVTRARVNDDGTVCPPADWMRGAEVDRNLALEMMTINAAYAIAQQDVVGSLTPGKYADLVVLTDDLLTVPTDSILDVEVLTTMIGGITEYCMPGAEAWCPGIGEVTPSETSLSVSASGSRDRQGPELAFDGIAEGESFWSSGGDAPQWIRVDFPEPASITDIRFTVYQNPPSDTVHRLEVLVGGEWQLLAEYDGFTTTGDILTWSPESPLDDVEALRMTTLTSLSWPEWYEIEITTR